MASEIRNRFTDTEMQIARETDLPELLSHLGYQVKRVGRFHTTTEMDSLRTVSYTHLTLPTTSRV